MICDRCAQERPTTGAIINGKYGQYCQECRSALYYPSLALNAAYNRDKDRSDNQRDLLQPWTPKGQPNKEFIANFPDEAHDIFSAEELEKYG